MVHESKSQSIDIYTSTVFFFQVILRYDYPNAIENFKDQINSRDVEIKYQKTKKFFCKVKSMYYFMKFNGTLEGRTRLGNDFSYCVG